MANVNVLGSYSPMRGYQLTAVGRDYTATLQLTCISEPYAYIYVSSNWTGDSFEAELNKSQITQFLSLDLVDDFIATALSFYKR